MQVLVWLGADQGRYLAVSRGALLVLGAAILAAAFSSRVAARLSTWSGVCAFLFLIVFVLLAARWPTFFIRDAASFDEDQFLAEANTVLRYPIPWLGFDPQPVGPTKVSSCDAT